MGRDDPDAAIDALEEAGRFGEAVAALEQRAADTGEDLRWHMAWMHTRAGNREDAAALWSALRAERADDPGLPYLEAAALLEDERFGEALPLLAEALDLGLRVSSDEALLRRVADERLDALRAAGRPPEAIDHRAREALSRHAPAVAWFPPDAFTAAAAAWGERLSTPGASATYEDYAAGLETHLRDSAAGVTGRNPVLVAIDAAEAEAFAAEHDWDAAWPVTHDQVAAQALRDDPGRGIAWPPGRNEPCWCGSARKYKRCCGR